MAKIALRVYNHEIEGLIEGGQVDEAIAHCQHILKTFPMHVETYRLLGKAYLEARRYGDAADIFLRLLQAIPDDFVTHVGMSIIRDEENKLDEAIWHMERAFQVQPSNPAIQSELRRLYGRRDGAEPPKIRLSRDALANMYVQGELYNQAITEIRAVLAEDPNRPDLQVMLARSYFRSGQKVESAEMAIQLLKKYPHCLDALRILLDVLPGTSRAEDTQTYRQRLRLLDPYSPYVTGSIFSSDSVADSAVTLEKLEYIPGGSPGAGQKDGDWAASLGVKMDQRSDKPEIPEWLDEKSGTVSVQDAETKPAEPSIVPDWLRDAGWKESNGQTFEGPNDLSEDDGAQAPGEIAQADIPEWLQSMAPPEVTGGIAETTNEAPIITGDLPDWLADAQKEVEDAQPGAGSSESTEVEDVPDWMGKMSSNEPVASSAEAAAEEAAGSSPEESLPAEEIPDWLGAIKADSSEGSLSEDLPPKDSMDEAPAPEAVTNEEIPEWLNQIGNDLSPEGLTERTGLEGGVAGEIPSALASSQDLPDWMDDSSIEDSQETLPTDESSTPVAQVQGEKTDEDQPDRLQKTTIDNLTDTISGATLPADFDKPIQSGTSQRLSIDDAALGWLESLAAKQGAKPEELLTKPEDRPTEAPDFDAKDAQTIAEEHQHQEPVQNPAQTKTLDQLSITESISEELTEPVIEGFDTGSSFPTDNIEIPSGVESDRGSSDGTTWRDSNQESDDDTLAGWLKNIDAEDKGDLPPVNQDDKAQIAEKPDLPDWLNDRPSDQKSEISSSEALGSIPPLPDWLQDESSASEPANEDEDWALEENTLGEPPVPTGPDEWVPAVGELGEQIHKDDQPVTTHAAVVPKQPDIPSAQMEDKTTPADKESMLLDSAQAALRQNHLDDAMQSYGKLIKKGKLLEEVIHDLKEANYRFPVDIIVWQTLGDAYMRANRLQEALDAYTEAEKLLR